MADPVTIYVSGVAVRITPSTPNVQVKQGPPPK